MKVIIPRIPQATTRRDLYRLASEMLSYRFRIPFTAPARITHCEIIEIRDGQGLTEHHGMIGIDSKAAGRWLIQRVQGKHLHNKMVFARRFVNRKANGVILHPLYERRRNDLAIARPDQSYPRHEDIEIAALAPHSSIAS